MEPVITAKNLTKIYKTKKVRINALNNVDLTVMPGEFLAIVGTSGSGKSTLLSLLAGLEPPTAGKIHIKGFPVHRMSESALVDFRLRHTGFVFQSFNLLPTLTAQENAAFALACRGVHKAEREKRARELLNAMGLSAHINHKPAELSGGQQQRVSIARAILAKPSILFADEPTGNLDSTTSGQVMELLRELVKQNNTTLLLVTHDLAKAGTADRVIKIHDGKIIPPDEIP